MTKKILIILTSHDRLGNTGEKTGFWLEEFAAPYYVMKDAGFALTLASPKGGQPPLDPKSNQPDFQTDATRRFEADEAAIAELSSTKKLSDIDAGSFDAVFYPGGHGPLWDLVTDEHSISLIEDFWAQGKPIAAVCHAPIVLVNARDETGAHIVKGRDVTGFTNGEEAAVELTDVVPLLVEDTLIERDGKYAKGEDFAPFVLRDGNLITGQNPASSEPAAKLLLDMLVA
ncbi:MAG: type 1 glutamine amidotransferase domain-containing protein [Pseudomonadota bacterium]